MRQALRALKKRVRDRRGFSLIELIVGMTILAIVSVPLLRTFVVASTFAMKAGNTGDATLEAQNLVERLYTTGIDSLSTATGFYNFYKEDGTAFGAGDSPPSSNKRFYAGFRGIGTRSAYDALIYYDASNPENDVEITQYTEMDAVFAQMSSSNPDMYAKDKLDEQANSDAVDSAGFINIYRWPTRNGDISRKITIDVTHDAVTGTYTASAVYSYMASYDYSYFRDEVHVSDSTVNPTVEFEPLEFYRSRTPMDNIFIFYYLAYELIDGGYIKQGDIIINNNVTAAPIEFELYIIEQKLTFFLYGGSSRYNVRINQNSLTANQAKLTTDPSNFTDYVFTNSGNIDNVGVYVHYFAYGHGYKTSLVKTTTRNRLYEFTLMLYPAGTLPSNTGDSVDVSAITPIATLTGSKMN